ncbi:MAG: hypothetical protein JWO80_5509 [Bryobacterales bacterium]|nr:hypothetical protein [Bryobacterales bacterium]
MEVSDDGVDLFVFGRDFYLGSASKTIENGWCEFEALGLEQAKAAFGSSRRLGTVWYLAERVPSDALRSFDEFRRQQLWLGVQGPSVARIIVDPIQTVRRLGKFGPGSECVFRAEADIKTALQNASSRRSVLTISAGEQFPLVLSFLEELAQTDNGVQKKMLLPPESEIHSITNARQLQASELEAARLQGEKNDTKWKEYERSKRDSEQVVDWFSTLSSSEVHQSIRTNLHDLAFRRSTKWLEQVRDNPQSDPKVWARASNVGPLLISIAGGNQRLARRTRCVDFITKKLVVDAATKILEELELERPEDSPANWAAEKAKRVYAALLRIGWSLKRQEGSHRTLQRSGWRDYVFAFHESVEIGPPILAEIGRSTGLRPEDL